MARMLIVLLLVTTAGCGRPAEPVVTELPPAADAANGELLYQHYCATCHGPTGQGDGPMARHLGKWQPSNLASGVYKFRSTPTGTLPTDADLARTIRLGVAQTTMPAFAGVFDAQRTADVVAYVKGLSPRFANEPQGEPLHMAAAEPPSNAISIGEGRKIYLLAKCWDCHGVDGRGDGPSAPTMKDARGRRTYVDDLAEGINKMGSHDSDVYRAFATGLDGTPMPSYLETIIVVRDFQEQLEPLRPHLAPDEFAELSEWVKSLMSLDDFYALPEEEQFKRMDLWRWDLVHYTNSLANDSWAGFWGLRPEAPLY